MIESGVYDALKADPIRFIKEVGPSLAKGGLLGCKNVEQGESIAALMILDNMSFLDVMRRFHVMDSKMEEKAEWMRAELVRQGGQMEWVNDGEDGLVAEVQVSWNGKTSRVRYAIDDAQKEGLIKKGGNWEKRPGDMLRARVSTRAIRMLAPELLSGCPSDEEMAAIQDEIIEPGGSSSSGASNGSNNTALPIPEDTPAELAEESPVKPEFADSVQVARIKELFASLSLSKEQIGRTLSKRNSSVVRNLSREEAAKLITALESKLAQVTDALESKLAQVTDALESKLAQVTDAIAGQTGQPKGNFSSPNNGPCSETQIKAIKQQMVDLQSPEIVQHVREHLRAHGKDKIAELTVTDADTLAEALAVKNLEAFLSKSLQPVGGSEAAKN